MTKKEIATKIVIGAGAAVLGAYAVKYLKKTGML